MSWTDWLDNRIRTISAATCTAKGVKLKNRNVPLPDGNVIVVPFPDDPLWHEGDYVSPDHPTRVTIPGGLEGRYHVLAEIHWRFNISEMFSIDFRDKSYFIAMIVLNGDPENSPHDPRSVGAPVALARTTTQTIVWETSLAAGDFLELSARWKNSQIETSPFPLVVEAWLTVRRL